MADPFLNNLADRTAGLASYGLPLGGPLQIVPQINQWLQGWNESGWVPTGITALAPGVLGFTFIQESESDPRLLLAEVQITQGTLSEFDIWIQGVCQNGRTIRGVAVLPGGLFLALLVVR